MARVARSIARTALPRLNPSRIANPSPRSNAASFVPRAFGNGASPSFRLSLRPASRPLRLRGEIAFLESLLPYHSAVSNACFVSRLSLCGEIVYLASPQPYHSVAASKACFVQD
eukprot:c19411_g1_i1 orf=408-749(-)